MRNSSLVEWSCAENLTGLKVYTEAWDPQCLFKYSRDFGICSRRELNSARKRSRVLEEALRMVGERRMRGEVVAEAAVDCIRVRMPE